MKAQVIDTDGEYKKITCLQERRIYLKPSSTNYMGLFGSDSDSGCGSGSSSRSRRHSKGLSEVQDELVKKYPPGAVVILTRTPSRSDDDFRRKYPEWKFPTCEEWIERFYKLQRSCGKNCTVWSKLRIETCGLEVCLEKLLDDSSSTS